MKDETIDFLLNYYYRKILEGGIMILDEKGDEMTIRVFIYGNKIREFEVNSDEIELVEINVMQGEKGDIARVHFRLKDEEKKCLKK